MPMTKFSPATNGFKFNNHFSNDFIPAIDWRTSGLCGGMSYAALDYYNTQRAIPTQPYRPANGTPLRSYLYNRNVEAITSNLDKWTELGFNPGGARNSEFFNWGISAKPGERIDELRQFIDQGTPAVLGLQAAGSTGNHEVIAFGYDLGRYKGDLGANIGDFKIFVCDPNFPGIVRTLIPDVAGQIYHYQEGGSDTWRTYFVDKNYHATEPPPAIVNTNYPKDGLVYELVLDFFTGGDDLRGGSDNVDLMVNLIDGSQQSYPNINLSSRWVVNSDENAEVFLANAIPESLIGILVISTTFSGGTDGDNWDMAALKIMSLGGGFYQQIQQAGFKRFSGDDSVLIVPVNAAPASPGEVNKLRFTFSTGGDDLRGVKDNVGVVIRFRDGQLQRVPNANGSHSWSNGTTNQVEIDLNRPVAPFSIVQIDLQTTFSGGSTGDNWDLAGLSVWATGNQVDSSLVGYGLKRFTGDDGFLAIPVVHTLRDLAGRLKIYSFKAILDRLDKLYLLDKRLVALRPALETCRAHGFLA